MRTLIVGAGAIGAYVGALLARDGREVVLFARGPHYRALRDRGVRVQSKLGSFVVYPQIVDDLDAAGPADLVVLGVKAHSLPDLAPRLRLLAGPSTVFLSTQNGIPWWYFQRHGGALEGLRIERIDPCGVISSAIPPERIVASIVYFSCDIAEPGLVRHLEGNRISLGELDGSRSERVRELAEILIHAGFRAPITTRIRHEIWVKLLGNLSLNPVSALTGATLARMLRDPDVASLIRNMMQEAESVATGLGVELPVSIAQRMAGAEKVGEHRTSMLQDVESGRPIEIEALVGAVLELGDRLKIEMPHTRAVYSCAKLLAQLRSRR